MRVSAIHTLTKCLDLVKNIPPSDVNIFPEYILPGLAHLTQDEAVIVRAAFAENIACLSHIALRYLDNSHLMKANNKKNPRQNYDSELQTLHEMVCFRREQSLYNNTKFVIHVLLVFSSFTSLYLCSSRTIRI